MTPRRRSKVPEIIVVDDSFVKSILADSWTFITVTGVIGVGWLLGSDAMQWCGFFLVTIALGSMACGRQDRMTVSQARKLLDEMEGRA